MTSDHTTVFRGLGAASLCLTLGLLASSAWGADPVKCNKCVGNKDLGKNAVDSSKVKNDAITTSKIKKNAVTGSRIKNGTVTLQDLAADVTAVINPDLDPIEVTVNCTGGDTIQDAVDAARPGVTTTIIVDGDCTEDVVIAKDDIVLSGDSDNSDSQGGESDLIGGITITGADRVVITNLTVRDNTSGSFPVGITATAGASATIRKTNVSGHVATGAVAGDGAGAGIFVTRNAYVTLDTVNVTNPVGGDAALELTDGATVRANDSNFISNDGSQFTGAAIGLYRAASIRLNGNSTVTNNVDDADPTRGLAINIADTSNLRIQSGTNTVTGNVLVETNSDADFRGVTFNSEVAIVSLSSLTISGGASITGDIDVERLSLLQAFTPSSITGDVTCTDSAIANLAITPSGVVSGC